MRVESLSKIWDEIDGKVVPVGTILSVARDYPPEAHAGILALLEEYDRSRPAEINVSKIEANQKQLDNERMNWQQQIATLSAENAQLKAQLSPAICEILPELEVAGLSEFMGSAITHASDNKAAVNLMLVLRSTAAEAPSIDQCDRIKNLFGEFCQLCQTVPTEDQKIALNAVLDVGPPSTGPVDPKFLRFV